MGPGQAGADLLGWGPASGNQTAAVVVVDGRDGIPGVGGFDAVGLADIAEVVRGCGPARTRPVGSGAGSPASATTIFNVEQARQALADLDSAIAQLTPAPTRARGPTTIRPRRRPGCPFPSDTGHGSEKPGTADILHPRGMASPRPVDEDPTMRG
jgi:hypothetical protein